MIDADTYLETDGFRVYIRSRNRDNLPNLGIGLSRNIVRQLGLQSGDLVCCRMWKKDSGIILPQSDIFFQKSTDRHLTKPERTFLINYSDYCAKGNFSLIDRERELAETNFGIQRTAYLIKNFKELL